MAPVCGTLTFATMTEALAALIETPEFAAYSLPLAYGALGRAGVLLSPNGRREA